MTRSTDMYVLKSVSVNDYMKSMSLSNVYMVQAFQGRRNAPQAPTPILRKQYLRKGSPRMAI